MDDLCLIFDVFVNVVFYFESIMCVIKNIGCSFQRSLELLIYLPCVFGSILDCDYMF